MASGSRYRFHVDAFREGLLALNPTGDLPMESRAAYELAAVFKALKGGRAAGGGTGGAGTIGLCRDMSVNVDSQEDSQEFKVR